MVMALGPLLLAGLLAAVTSGWLSSRPQPLGQVIGLLLAVMIVTVCGLIAFALIADDVDAQLIVAGLLSLLSFSALGTASAISAYRGLKAHAGASARSIRR